MGIMYKLMKHRKLSKMDLPALATSSSKSSKTLKKKADKVRMLTLEGNIIETSIATSSSSSSSSSASSPPSTPSSSPSSTTQNLDKQFTAEHILQLCKFLAEKSKRNKNLYRKQQSPKNINKSAKEFQFSQLNNEPEKTVKYNRNMKDQHYADDDDEDEDDCRISSSTPADQDYQTEALPLISNLRLEREHEKPEKQNKYKKLNSVLTARLMATTTSSANKANIASNIQQQQQQMQQHQRLQHLYQDSMQQQQHQEQEPHYNHQQEQEHHEQQQQHYHNNQHHQHHHQHHNNLNQQQGKRDILLKIRHQIFERKRLRAKCYDESSDEYMEEVVSSSTTASATTPILNHLQSQEVWRPW